MAAELDPNSLIVNGGFAAGLLTLLGYFGKHLIGLIRELVTNQRDHHAEDTAFHVATATKLDELLERKHATPPLGIKIPPKNRPPTNTSGG